jgi:hypothetical protein
MRFLSFSNKKNLRQKYLNPDCRAGQARHTGAVWKRVKFCHFFFLVNLGTFGRFLSGR